MKRGKKQSIDTGPKMTQVTELVEDIQNLSLLHKFKKTEERLNTLHENIN
jgi:cell fate (sporulation/competence/biofilm development) regulator YmcA (YheA/YmcA/DUF963 family)